MKKKDYSIVKYSIDKIIRFPITDSIDLHTFNPRDLKPLLMDYLIECRKKGILEVKIIHGKGKGILRKRVHKLLSSFTFVENFYMAEPYAGGWGATIVRVKSPPKK